jgi:DNA-binding MurR/RpiR family transcriptional regulator
MNGGTPAEAEARESSVADQLRRFLPDLTTAERRVARSLLVGYPAIGLGTAAELAELSSTSSATVVRLVQKLGYAGFPDFQVTLRKELSVRRSGPVERLSGTPSDWPDGSLLVSMATSLSQIAASVIQTVPAAEFDAAVALLADTSRRVHLLGGRVTHQLATYLGQHLTRLRPGISILSRDPADEVTTLLETSKRDVFVVFDVRRYERGTLETTQMAARQGARILVITDIYLSPVAQLGTVVLPIQVQVPSPFDSAVAGLVLAEALATATLKALGDTGVQRMRLWDAMTESRLVED